MAFANWTTIFRTTKIDSVPHVFSVFSIFSWKWSNGLKSTEQSLTITDWIGYTNTLLPINIVQKNKTIISIQHNWLVLQIHPRPYHPPKIIDISYTFPPNQVGGITYNPLHSNLEHHPCILNQMIHYII